MKNYFDLTGKVAIVTGASSGLGVQFAKALINQGAKVALVARRLEKLEQVKAEIEKMGGECDVFKCDVCDSKAVEDMVKKVCNRFGTIDILVNNAGVASEVSTVEMSDDEWKRVIDPNLNGVFYVGREVAKVMVAKNYGKIINIGSIHSNVSLMADAASLAPYCASKGAVQMLTKAWAVEWASKNITVNAIAPAYFSSEMTDQYLENGFEQIIQIFCPMKRAGQEGELDGALIYLASDSSSYTSGQLISVDGAWTSL